MKKVIIAFIKDKIASLENGYAQNYVAEKELETISNKTPKNNSDIDACKFNMEKALEKIKFYKALLKSESKE